MSSNVDSDNNNDGKFGPNQKKQQPQYQQRKNDNSHSHHTTTQISGMTPSIITTINNTSPHPPTEYPNSITNNCNTLTRNRRTNEPYESYIEDSFVGHWEREDDDDDPEGNYHGDNNRNVADGDADGEESALQHASTLEFDFDSFGPESFIYTPASTTTTTTSNTTVVAKGSNTPTTEELSPKILDTDEVQANLASQQPDVVNQIQNGSNTEETPSTESSRPIPPAQTTYKINSNPPDYLVDPTQIDLKVIEPYKKVISHAGYCHHFDPSVEPANAGEPAPAIIVFSACYLPDRSRRDYNYVMDHLFLYVLTSLHELIADDYILIYLHNTQPSNSTVTNSNTSRLVTSGSSTSTGSSSDEIQNPNNLPTFTWMKRCYQMIDRKLRKNLKILYLVKPTFWLKTIVIMCKPFISAKFSRKLRFVENMDGLRKCLPVDKLILPASAENL